ncbi:MAG: amidase [Polynucleobacter sp. 24-46-87]|jgi:Asp-tRNA(Asn)/Glu-tRNA(Gln) amidotransferase A subunit family amidase|uniref:amidase n=1 Tax=unclassified Polynucleobacter TaxID=2640945 RepID=UPI000BD7C4D0|nr:MULTISPECIES: amidase [unclassified Polynucleobacter]OYY12742.1 MAG: amidase [Polynucleobacter sp. 35-46-11]OZA14056.1 MAG: amidase [Polynucleobacter sp. 24-46-87]OZA76929.1 MAG: amidase [Polynucleobacter sp. 39-46-10]
MKKNIGLTEACNLIDSQQLNPVDFIKECSTAADEVEPTLKSFVCRASVDSMVSAIKPGLLSGIPVAVKDIINTVNLPTTNGSPIYKDVTPTQDAAIVEKIRSLGGIIFGKSVTTEFAWRNPGPTTNPFNSEHTPGGSSSGSAAAVAAGIVPLALGSQTQGSIVRPAAYCGVIGYKASYGAVSKEGAHPLSYSLDHIGFFTRSVNDAAYAFNCLKNSNSSDPDLIVIPDLFFDVNKVLPSFDRPKIAFLETPIDYMMSDDQKGVLQIAAKRLEDAGATTQKLTLPKEYWDAIQSMNLIMEAEAAEIHASHIDNSSELLSVHIKELVKRGLQHNAPSYIAAKSLQKKLRATIGAYFQEFDAFLMAPASGEAPKSLDSTGDPIFCALWSYLGVPSITIPVKKSQNGLPLGIQLIGGYGDDAKLLSIAKFAESALA